MEFGLLTELTAALSDETEFGQLVASPYITSQRFDDGVTTWSLSPEMRSYFHQTLQPQTINELGTTALKLISFACPPCYEGNTTW